MQNERPSFFKRLTGRKTIETTHSEAIEPTEVYEDEGSDEEADLAVDVYQNANNIVIQTMVAGVKIDDLDVSITRDTVVIHGVRKQQLSTTADYLAQELYWGPFSRTVVLPEEIDVEGASASETHGLLTITLPKIDKHKQARVKVKSV